LNEEFKEEAQDTDFCFRIQDAGYKVMYNPKAEIYHLECSTRDWRKGEIDRVLLNEKWGEKILQLAKKGEQRVKYDPNEYLGSIVIIRDDGIGDLLMGISAFNNLKLKNPAKKIILATYERNVEMMMEFEIFNEIIAIPNQRKYSPLPIPTLGTKIYNLIDMEMDFKPIHGVPREDNKVHRHISFSKAIDIDSDFKLVKMPTYHKAKDKINKLLKKMDVDISQKFITLNLTATNPARSWWGPYYSKLISKIEEMGYIPVITGTVESEYFKGNKIVNLIGKTKSIAEYIEAIKLGQYVISTDTSAYHIAALSGIPFLAIFTGGVKAEARLSYYEKYESIEPMGLACHPCWDEGCTDLSVRWKKDPCRLMIKPEEVIEKFDKLIKRYPKYNNIK
jgi:ADP-heptose:LPS heptosyltransferase